MIKIIKHFFSESELNIGSMSDSGLKLLLKLTDSWFHTTLHTNDKILLLYDSTTVENSTVILDNTKPNLLITYPDRLVSVNEVSGAIFCRRRFEI